MTNENKGQLSRSLVLSALIIVAGGLGTLLKTKEKANFAKAFDPNFVDTRKVVMESKDLDNNGKKESILEYSGRNYLMKYNQETNTVSIVPYELRVEER